MVFSKSAELCNHRHKEVLEAFHPQERSPCCPLGPGAAPPWAASSLPALSLPPSLLLSLSLFPGCFMSTTEARVCFPRRTGDKCVLHFKPCGLFGKELHKVEGYIQDKK